ncbi:UdgX family uracil-DNA binding protein [Parvularcula sp. LCG005]|uniref:UdgX family uracil-DNA binding protein n=1 Tax=Parvularcula sp. LCG005 TaxID=3078805 RepID=UPI0029437289|nr:UdgX family uracil-DNA binding protein [Parvularcula sp. LCG005]WOI54688.1 UdgX family uracil-DNA binding protein [Parvularcula sp. LCG005]
MIVSLDAETDFAGWRNHARRLCAKGIRPSEIEWRTPGMVADLFGVEPRGRNRASSDDRPVTASRRFLTLAERVVAHRDPSRFARLYEILYRLQEQPQFLNNTSDPLICWLMAAEKAIRRDVHKMHAFVRFRKAGETDEGRECFAAWFEPEHRITRLAAPFFQRRFAAMNWLIVTPEDRAQWNGAELTFGPGGTQADVPDVDDMEEGWRQYYSSIFNPARLKISAMKSEMPVKYWRNLPEASLIPSLIQRAEDQQRAMIDRGGSEVNARVEKWTHQPATIAATPAQTLEELNTQARACTRCGLCEQASQTVCGQGPHNARLMLVGEQPGDEEDIAGRPFIGPAGRLLDSVLTEAGIDRKTSYVTNAVKHFKFEPRGKRRLHKTPNIKEIDHCRWWLNEERRLIAPKLIVGLGATAARSLLGKSVKLSENRGRILPVDPQTHVLLTVHPSYLLRLPDREHAASERRAFVRDLTMARQFMDHSQTPAFASHAP